MIITLKLQGWIFNQYSWNDPYVVIVINVQTVSVCCITRSNKLKYIMNSLKNFCYDITRTRVMFGMQHRLVVHYQV